MFRRILSWLRQVAAKMTGNVKVADIARSGTVVTDDMTNAIDFWIALYEGQAPWLSKNRQTLGLPATIASEIARLVTLEMEMNITGNESGNARAEYIKEQMTPVIESIRQYCEYGCAGGGLVFKPYIDGDSIAVDIVQANAFYPIAFNSRGKIISAVFVERKTDGDTIYSRIETHRYESKAYYVSNKAYKSYNKNDIGNECPLSSVQEWSGLEPEVILQNVTGPLFSYFKIPQGNTVDTSSPLGVSVYSRAVTLIEDADKQYQRLMWEFEGGELAIDASEDLFKVEKGEPVLPVGKERLYRPNKLDAATSSSETLMKEWSPNLRDGSIINGLNRILVAIEDNCSISRGTISNQVIDARTAEEIKQLKQRSYSTVKDIQKALQVALDDLIYAIDVYTTLYNLAPKGEYTVTYTWDDSIIINAEIEREIDRQDCRDGAMQWWEYRMKWRGEDEKTAKKMTNFTEEKSDAEVFGFDKAGAEKKPEPKNQNAE